MLTRNESGSEPQKGNKKKLLFLSLGLLAAGTLTFFGIHYFSKKKEKKKAKKTPDIKTTTTVKKTKTSSVPPKKAKPVVAAPTKPAVKTPEIKILEFPLRKGSRGSKVKALQQALITAHGKSILPKSGADGIFGNELLSALRKLKLPESVSESLYNTLVPTKKYDPRQVATLLNTAANSKEFNRTMVLLKTIPNTKVYGEVNGFFKGLLTGGVRKTLVSGLLSAFADPLQKQAIRLEFVRMGLKYDGAKWSLAGNATSPLIITTQQTKVWKDPKTSVGVPINMVLGKQITTRGKFTLFENEAKLFLVETEHIKEYSA